MTRTGRAYHKGWQSDRPLKPTSRKVKWYRGETTRLQFEDTTGKIHRVYKSVEVATSVYESYIAGDFDAVHAPYEEEVDMSRD